jgi:hypothetical protein
VSGSKLDPAFKAKWVAALLSGEYQQTSEHCAAKQASAVWEWPVMLAVRALGSG